MPASRKRRYDNRASSGRGRHSGQRECLDCGMLVFDMAICPKCDSQLDAQHDGSTRQVDIAHHRETEREAMAKLQQEITTAGFHPAQYLRLVVGSGVIRDAALAELHYYQHRHQIVSYEQEAGNRGAILIKLKP